MSANVGAKSGHFCPAISIISVKNENIRQFFVISQAANYYTLIYMEITVKIIQVMPLRSGKSARTGNDWAAQEFVLETIQDQYPRHCVFEVFGQDRLSQMSIQQGETLTVSFDIDAREYNGRWYNSIRAWKVERNVAAAPAPAPIDAAAANIPPTVPAPTLNNAPAEGDKVDDLPF